MRKTFAATAILLSGAILVGCSSSPSDTKTAAVVNPDGIVDIRVSIEPTGLDVTNTSGAALQQLMRGNVYEGLVGRTDEGSITPALASEWEVSEDGKTYTFTLRDGVTFHDGTPLTADDVVESLQASRSEGSQNPDAKRMTAVETVEAPDAQTVVINLSAQDINFLDALTTSAGLVVSQASTVDRASEANGTGPYTVAQWNQGSTITLEPFADYWGDAPQNGGAVFHYITDETTAATAMSSGDLDLMLGVTPETAELFRSDDAFQVVDGDSTSWMVLGMNHEVEALSDQRVRQALRQGIDKAGLIEVTGGQSMEVGTITVPSDTWHVDETDSAPYDPEAARKLLAEAGQSDLELTLTVANTYDSIIAEYIASQLSEIGVTINIETVEFAAWLENAFNQKQYELTVVMHVDPQMITYYANPDYYWNYDNAEVQSLVTAARETDDTSVRDENLREVASILAEDSASDWLYSPQTVIVADDGAAGFAVDRIANHFLLSDITVAQ